MVKRYYSFLSLFIGIYKKRKECLEPVIEKESETQRLGKPEPEDSHCKHWKGVFTGEKKQTSYSPP